MSDYKNDKASELRILKLIHEQHITDFIALEELLKNPIYENISVKELRKSAKIISGSIRNFLHDFKKLEDGQIGHLVTDKDNSDRYFWRNMAILGVKNHPVNNVESMLPDKSLEEKEGEE